MTIAPAPTAADAPAPAAGPETHATHDPGGARAALAARYGVDLAAVEDVAPGAAAGLAPAADRPGTVLATQLRHRTVRRYRTDPLAHHVVPTLVAAAQSAPTSSNLQLWSVVAVTDPVRKARLAALAGDQEHVRPAPLLRVWLAAVGRARARGAPSPSQSLAPRALAAGVDPADGEADRLAQVAGARLDATAPVSSSALAVPRER